MPLREHCYRGFSYRVFSPDFLGPWLFIAGFYRPGSEIHKCHASVPDKVSPQQLSKGQAGLLGAGGGLPVRVCAGHGQPVFGRASMQLRRHAVHSGALSMTTLASVPRSDYWVGLIIFTYASLILHRLSCVKLSSLCIWIRHGSLISCFPCTLSWWCKCDSSRNQFVVQQCSTSRVIPRYSKQGRNQKQAVRKGHLAAPKSRAGAARAPWVLLEVRWLKSCWSAAASPLGYWSGWSWALCFLWGGRSSFCPTWRIIFRTTEVQVA